MRHTSSIGTQIVEAQHCLKIHTIIPPIFRQLYIIPTNTANTSWRSAPWNVYKDSHVLFV